jgi:hypothetical protein
MVLQHLDKPLSNDARGTQNSYRDFAWHKGLLEILQQVMKVYFRGVVSVRNEYSFSGPKRRFSAYMRQRLHTMRRLAITGIER